MRLAVRDRHRPPPAEPIRSAHAGGGEPSLGARLRTRREQLGITQAELADATGIQISLISAYENGRCRPRAPNLRLLLDALEMAARELAREAWEALDHAIARALSAEPGPRRLLVAWIDAEGIVAIAAEPDGQLLTLRASATPTCAEDLAAVRALADRLTVARR